MVTWVFGKTIMKRNRTKWLEELVGQIIYLATGQELKEARILNWEPYKAPRMDKSSQVPHLGAPWYTWLFQSLAYFLCDAHPPAEVSLTVNW